MKRNLWRSVSFLFSLSFFLLISLKIEVEWGKSEALKFIASKQYKCYVPCLYMFNVSNFNIFSQ